MEDAPSLTVNHIGTEPGHIPQKHRAPLLFRLAGDGREGFPLPALDGFRVALLGPLQRLVRCQPQFRQQLADGRHARRNTESLGDQFDDYRTRPQPEVQNYTVADRSRWSSETSAFPGLRSKFAAVPWPSSNATH